MDTREDSSAGGTVDVVGCEWRTYVMYGETEVVTRTFDPVRDLLPLVVEKLRADPSLLEYRRDDEHGEHWRSAGKPRGRQLEHWLTADQVARLPSGLGGVEWADVPYKEPLQFVAERWPHASFFEYAIRAGAMPLVEGVELGLHALRLFILSQAKEPRPDLLMPTTQDPSRWIDDCERLIGLLQSMVVEFREAGGADGGGVERRRRTGLRRRRIT